MNFEKVNVIALKALLIWVSCTGVASQAQQLSEFWIYYRTYANLGGGISNGAKADDPTNWPMLDSIIKPPFNTAIGIKLDDKYLPPVTMDVKTRQEENEESSENGKTDSKETKPGVISETIGKPSNETETCKLHDVRTLTATTTSSPNMSGGKPKEESQNENTNSKEDSGESKPEMRVHPILKSSSEPAMGTREVENKESEEESAETKPDLKVSALFDSSVAFKAEDTSKVTKTTSSLFNSSGMDDKISEKRKEEGLDSNEEKNTAAKADKNAMLQAETLEKDFDEGFEENVMSKEEIRAKPKPNEAKKDTPFVTLQKIGMQLKEKIDFLNQGKGKPKEGNVITDDKTDEMPKIAVPFNIMAITGQMPLETDFTVTNTRELMFESPTDGAIEDHYSAAQKKQFNFTVSLPVTQTIQSLSVVFKGVNDKEEPREARCHLMSQNVLSTVPSSPRTSRSFACFEV